MRMDVVRSVRVKFSVSEIVQGLKKLYPDDPLVQSMPEGEERRVPGIACFGDQFGVSLSWEQLPEPKDDPAS
jgi:hypothetical protein